MVLLLQNFVSVKYWSTISSIVMLPRQRFWVVSRFAEMEVTRTFMKAFISSSSNEKETD